MAKRETITCAACGRPFEAWISARRTYCTPQCGFDAQRVPVDVRMARLTDRSGDCWLWTGSRTNIGYGSIVVGGRTFSAHRMAYELAYGPIPAGAVVLHTCDNRLCVRPEHLRTGTQRENIRDALRKGRMLGPRGETQGRSKLTREQVVEIARRARAGERQIDLASEFGISQAQACRIANGRTWRWLNESEAHHGKEALTMSSPLPKSASTLV